MLSFVLSFAKQQNSPHFSRTPQIFFCHGNQFSILQDHTQKVKFQQATVGAVAGVIGQIVSDVVTSVISQEVKVTPHK